MGVIRRQTLKHTVVNLGGLVIGAIGTLFVYPHALEAYGLMKVLVEVGVVGLPVLSLGANTVAIRYFPEFQDKHSGHNGFLRLLLRLCLRGWTVALLMALGVVLTMHWTQPDWWQNLAVRSPLLIRYGWIAAPLALFYVVGVVFSSYSANFKRIVVPSLLLDFSQRLIQPILLLAVWQGWLPLGAALIGLLIHSVLVVVALGLYLRSLGEWHWRPSSNFLTPERRRDMLQFIAFGVFGGAALQLASKVDILMVGSMSTLQQTGIYAIATYMATVIEIPIKGMYAASASSVAKYLADDDRPELEKLYKQVSINLLIVGLFLFGAILVSVDNLYRLLPNGHTLSAGKGVLVLVGLSRLVEMATGLNNYMIYYSRYYRYSLISLGLMAVINIGMNLWLIPRLGLSGAALSTLISVSCYNLFSLLLVWKKFGLLPFTRRTPLALLAAGLMLGLMYCLPRLPWPLLDVMLHSGLYAAGFAALTIWWRLSPELTDLASKALLVLRRWWKGEARGEK